MNEQTQLAQMTPQQRQAIAKAKARLRLKQQGQPAAPAAPARPTMDPLHMVKPEARAQVQANQQTRSLPMTPRPDPNAPNPIITAQRRSQVDAGNAFATKAKTSYLREGGRTAVDEMGRPLPADVQSFNEDDAYAVDRDVGKGALTLPVRAVNAASNTLESAANLPGDALQSMMGGERAIPRADVPSVPLPKNLESVTGDLSQGIMQFLMARGVIGKAAPGGGNLANAGKDAAALFAGFDSDTPRLTETLAADFMRQNGMGWMADRDPNNPLMERVKNGIEEMFLAYAPVEAVKRAPGAIDAITGVRQNNLTPTNAGAAPRPQQAPQPSVAPAPQARATGAGQQPPVSPPTLNAVPTTPAVPKQQMLVARDTAKILTRIMRAANVKNADIRGYLPGAVQRYKSLNDSRVPFAFFLESDLPKHFAEPVAADVVTKLQGWGRARNAAMGTGDKSAQITQGTIKELRGSQQDFLTKSAEANLYKGSLISQEDQILKSLRETGRKGYEPSLDYARQAIDGRRKPSAAEAQAVDDLRQILARPTLQKYVDDATRIRAEKDGIDIDQLIKDDPIGSAHWLQSEFRRLSDASEDALTGKPTRTSGAYDDLREMILDPLKRASPGYEGAMMRFGHDFGSKEAVTFGKGIFTASRGAYDTAQKIRKFKKLGRRQQTVAWKSIRDEFLNEFRGTPEDAAAKLTRMQQEGALDLLEQMGARGKRFADDIRRIAQQENPSIRAIEQASNSLTFKNLSGAEAAREMVQSPINQVVGSVTDKASWPMTLAADAVVMGTTGIPVPMLTASKAMDRFGNPGPKTLSRATEGLYGLPSKASGSTPELMKASRGGGGRPKGGAPQVEQDIGALLKALDEVEADPKRRGGPEGKRLLNQIAAAQGGKPAKPKRQKVAAAPATGLGTAAPTATPAKPGQTSNASPTVTGALVGGGLGYVGSDGDPMATLAGATGLGAASGLAAKAMKGGKPKASPAKPAFDQRFMKEAQRLVSYNGGVDKALKAQQYVIDQLKNSKAPNAQDRLNRAVSVQYAIRRMAERSNRELDEIVPMADAPATGPKPIDPSTNYNIDPRGDKFIIRTDAGEEVLGAPEFPDRKQALAWLQGETRKARQGGAAPIPGERSIKPPKRNGVSNMVAGGVIGSAIGSLGGEADAQEDLSGKISATEQTIADLKKAMADMDKITDPFEKQRQLKAAGYYAGKIDGNIAGKTTEGLERLRAKREADLAKAEDELTDLVRREAYQTNRPDPAMMALREYAPTLGFIGGVLGLKFMRGNAAKASIKTAETASNKLNKLITKGPVTGAMNKRDENRFANLNKLWQKGGASKDELPFKQDSVGNYKANPKAKLAEELFSDNGVWQAVTKYVKGKDLAIILGGGVDVAYTQTQIDRVSGDLEKAEKEWEDKPSKETFKRVEDLKNEKATYEFLQRLGAGIVGGRILGSFGGAYAKPMPNIPGAASEQAKLKQFIAGRRPPPKPRTPRRPTPPQPTPAGPTTGLGGPTQLPLPLKGGGKKKP